MTLPLQQFGLKILSKRNNLPLIIKGCEKPKSISYFEKKGSAQCKTSIMFAALKANGTTFIKAKKSRNHTELLFKSLILPLKFNKNNQGC